MLNKKWSILESQLLLYYEKGESKLDNEDKLFLEKLGFWKENEISDLGKKYLDSKFTFETKEYNKILKNRLLKIKEFRRLCQAFYGQKTKRDKVERFFKTKTEITDRKEIGRILLLLNSMDIVNYSKRNKTVKFKEVPAIEEESQESYEISKKTPYSNIKRLRRCIRSCKGQLKWIDKHFSKKGFEPLSDEITGDKISTISILCGTANINEEMQDDFKRFRDEMEKRDVKVELKVITSKNVYHEIHDRFILSSRGDSWNLPPIDSLYMGQEAEIHKTEKSLPFEKWWVKSKDIIKDWGEIKKYMKD